MLDNGLASDTDDEKNDLIFSPCPKRLRFDDDYLLDKAKLADAANVKDTENASKTYLESIASVASSKCIRAIQEELKTHKVMGSCVFEWITENVRPIGCRWAFAKKQDEHGTVNTNMARLVSKGV